MMKLKLLKCCKDIRFWIILFFLIRLIGITNPPIEGGHSWRQCFTSMVSRNFVEKEANILYPRIDMAGEKDDVVACEFPLFNYLMFLLAKVFGFADWYGRLLNLVLCSIATYCFYLLVKRFFTERIAFNAAIILLASIWFNYSRKIMPDTFSVGLILIGLFLLSRYWDTAQWKYLVVYGLLAALGGLCKIPSVLLLVPIGLCLFNDSISFTQKTGTTIATAIVLFLVVVWYFYWEPYLLVTYGNQLYYPFTLKEGFEQFCLHWQGVLAKFYFDAFYSFIAFAAFLIGLFWMIKMRHQLLLAIFGLSTVVLLFFAVKTGDIFPTHNYYIIPFVPIMALIAAYGIDKLPLKKYSWIVLVLISIEGIANQQHDFFLKKDQVYKLQLERIADSISLKTDKVCVNGGMNPQLMYFVHRKGWSLSNETLNDSLKRTVLREQGCKYVFIDIRESPMELPCSVVYADDAFVVYELN